MSPRTRDVLGSLVMLAFVGILWVQRDYITPFGGIFPDLVMLGLAGLAVVTLVLAFTPYRALKEDARGPKAQGARNWFGMALVAAILLAWTALLRTLGFAAAGVVGFTVISWYLSARRTALRTVAGCLVTGAVVTYLLIFVFETLLKVPLPAGTLFG